MQQLSFNRSINNSNIRFRKKKILLVIDDKTNNLKTKTTPKIINFGCKVCDVVADSKDLHTKSAFALIDTTANNMAVMTTLLGEPVYQ